MISSRTKSKLEREVAGTREASAAQPATGSPVKLATALPPATRVSYPSSCFVTCIVVFLHSPVQRYLCLFVLFDLITPALLPLDST